MDDVVWLLLHNKFPVALVDKVDVPQLSTTVTTGVAGVVFGAATPEPAALVQPFTDCVTLYVPAEETVIENVVWLSLHNSVPVAVVDKVDVPLQLSTTVTTGLDGVVFGAATPEPDALIQPSTDCVIP
jgi:putative N-acetylmannosamine-6-phosphate epimerase